MKRTENIVDQRELITLTSADSLITLIDNQIKQIERDYLSDWERDHSYSKADRDARIQSLEEKKKYYKEMFSKAGNTPKIVVNVTLQDENTTVMQEDTEAIKL
ncbi:hypothetical protein SAMN05216474_3157 [Lishizhenia tianjinensis]|uniref:Uncharacterized protein n=1 Tax=Lishizhenia tianjinensis TaxID=477690 RepID=A0A1I7BWZ6_9FLAO|nr:hypothetical protein [Lishizhenia tianjinensis]SFT91718.1 hypothetical protein SAMN05216474_3157 [Lishizhenia tianjinensis]